MTAPSDAATKNKLPIKEFNKSHFTGAEPRSTTKYKCFERRKWRALTARAHLELAVSHSTTLSKLMLRVQLMLIIVHLFSVM